MKGINTLEINYSVLEDALQEYFDKHLVDKPVIKEIWLPSLGKMGTSNSIKLVLQGNGAFLNGEE